VEKAGESRIRGHESSPGFTRSHCDLCGSVLPVKNVDDDSYYAPAGLLDGDPGARPHAHIFAESKAPWYEITDALPQITAYGEDSEQAVIQQKDREHRHGTNHTAGSCLCDAVQYRFSGAAEFMMYCHCTRCRKVKGAAHAANLFVKIEQFEWISGEDNITVYDLPGAVRFGNSFCQTCGSSVPRNAAGAPVYNIPIGSLDDDPVTTSRGHIYVASKSAWYDIHDSLPQFDEMPT